MSKLIDRALHVHGSTGIIETRGVTGSIFLYWWQNHSGTDYELRKGVRGSVLLKLFVASNKIRVKR